MTSRTVGFLLLVLCAAAPLGRCTEATAPALDATSEDARPDDGTVPEGEDGETDGGCAEGETVCDGRCVDTLTDRTNCGRCGNVCGSLEICYDGDCMLECPAGTTSCSGHCTDLESDPSNCGVCGRACSGGQVCSAGTCTTTCGAGLTNCSGACVDTLADPRNCGTCGYACASDEVCSGGSCACVPDCYGKVCGPDGCGGSCGSCDAGLACTAEGNCQFDHVDMSISRTPVTSAASPFHAGDSTVFTMDVAPWSWVQANVSEVTFKSTTTDIGTGSVTPDPDFIASMSDILAQGLCDASGHCPISGTWEASQFLCGTNVMNTRAREEWVEILSYTSNHNTFYFHCSDGPP